MQTTGIFITTNHSFTYINSCTKIPIWQDTHIYETQISGVTVLHKVYEVYVVYKQGPRGLGYDIKFIEKE